MGYWLSTLAPGYWFQSYPQSACLILTYSPLGQNAGEVPTPDTTQPLASFHNLCVEPLLTQPMQQITSREPSTDDQGVQLQTRAMTVCIAVWSVGRLVTERSLHLLLYE